MSVTYTLVSKNAIDHAVMPFGEAVELARPLLPRDLGVRVDRLLDGDA